MNNIGPSVRVQSTQMPSQKLSDEQLMGCVARGETEAIELLYERYAATIMGLAIKMLGEPVAAEEVVQETFWRVWRNADSFQAKQGRFSTWLFGIARNLCVDLWRKKKVRPSLILHSDDSYHLDQLSDQNLDVAELTWTSIKHTQVRAAMATLPAPQRHVLELAYFWGLTRQEIAEELTIPLGTVHTRARLGLQKLRQALRAQGFEE